MGTRRVLRYVERGGQIFVADRTADDRLEHFGLARRQMPVVRTDGRGPGGYNVERGGNPDEACHVSAQNERCGDSDCKSRDADGDLGPVHYHRSSIKGDPTLLDGLREGSRSGTDR